MARLTENIFEQRQSSFVEAVIVDCPTGDSPDTDHDTACVEVPSMYSIVHGAKILKNIPIFYHCEANPDRHGRSLEGAATAFRKGDHVILSTNPLAIVGFADGSLRRCRKLYLYLRIKDINFDQGSEQYLIWDVEENTSAKLKKLDGSTISFPATREDLEDVNWFERREVVGEGVFDMNSSSDYLIWGVTKFDRKFTGYFCQSEDCPVEDSGGDSSSYSETFCCYGTDEHCLRPCHNQRVENNFWGSKIFEPDNSQQLTLNQFCSRIWKKGTTSYDLHWLYIGSGSCLSNHCVLEHTSSNFQIYYVSIIANDDKAFDLEYSRNQFNESIQFHQVNYKFPSISIPHAKFDRYSFCTKFLISKKFDFYWSLANQEVNVVESPPQEYVFDSSLFVDIQPDALIDQQDMFKAKLPLMFETYLEQAIQFATGSNDNPFLKYDCYFCYA